LAYRKVLGRHVPVKVTKELRLSTQYPPGIKTGTSGVRSRSPKCWCGTYWQRNGLTPATFTLNTASFHITKLGLLPHDVFLSSVWSSEQTEKEQNWAVPGCYHYSLRNSPEERGSHLLRDGSLKSGKQKGFSYAAVSKLCGRNWNSVLFSRGFGLPNDGLP